MLFCDLKNYFSLLYVNLFQSLFKFECFFYSTKMKYNVSTQNEANNTAKKLFQNIEKRNSPKYIFMHLSKALELIPYISNHQKNWMVIRNE